MLDSVAESIEAAGVDSRAVSLSLAEVIHSEMYESDSYRSELLSDTAFRFCRRS